jgi:hypothetical protein
MLTLDQGRLSTLTSRSIFFRADIQKMKSPSDYGEFRQSRTRRLTLRSLDHLIGTQQQRLRDRDSERLSGLEVDD